MDCRQAGMMADGVELNKEIRPPARCACVCTYVCVHVCVYSTMSPVPHMMVVLLTCARLHACIHEFVQACTQVACRAPPPRR